MALSPIGVRLCSLHKLHCVPNVSSGFSCPYHCYSCLSSGSSFYELLQLSLYSRHICREESCFFAPQRSGTKTCANKTNIYALAEICSPNSPLHKHAGRLLTGPQITQEASTAVGCGDLAGLLITLGQTETWHKAPLARGIAVKLLLWKNKIGRLLRDQEGFGSSS